MATRSGPESCGGFPHIFRLDPEQSTVAPASGPDRAHRRHVDAGGTEPRQRGGDRAHAVVAFDQENGLRLRQFESGTLRGHEKCRRIDRHDVDLGFARAWEGVDREQIDARIAQRAEDPRSFSRLVGRGDVVVVRLSDGVHRFLLFSQASPEYPPLATSVMKPRSRGFRTFQSWIRSLYDSRSSNAKRSRNGSGSGGRSGGRRDRPTSPGGARPAPPWAAPCPRTWWLIHFPFSALWRGS